MAQVPRRRGMAVVLSALVWPGAGQVYLRRWLRGLLLIVGSGGALGVLLVQLVLTGLSLVPTDGSIPDPFALADQLQQNLPASAWWLQVLVVACWVVGVLDAWLGPPAP